MKYLSLDIGEKRIGVASSDSGIIVSEYATLIMDTWQQTLSEIYAILKKEQVEILVVGLPVNMDGTESKYSKIIREYMVSLEKEIAKGKLPTKIFFEDERLTSSEAERQLRERKYTQDEIKKKVDSFAARLILEQYLDNK